MVQLLGADLGPTPAVAGQDNERGFWEHPDVVAVHESVLETLGSSWDDPAPLPENWWESEAVRPHRDRLRRILRRDFLLPDLWSVKDPRLCRLLPLWREPLAENGIEPGFIFCVRHPAEVAGSLGRRNGMDPAASELLWFSHMAEALRHTRGRPLVFVRYDKVLADWRTEARRIARTLDFRWPRSIEDAGWAVDEFLDPALRHHRMPAPSAEGADFYSPWGKRLHEFLWDAASRDPGREDGAGIESLLAETDKAGQFYGPVLRRITADRKALLREAERLRASASESEAKERAIHRVEEEWVRRLDEQMDLEKKLEERVEELREEISRLSSRRCRIVSVSPPWAVVGEGVNLQDDGSSHVLVKARGDRMNHAFIVLGDIPLLTSYSPGGYFSADVPASFLKRAGLHPLWIESHEYGRRVTGIHCFRVLSPGYVLRLSKGNILIRLIFALRWRSRIPWFYAVRAAGRLKVRLKALRERIRDRRGTLPAGRFGNIPPPPVTPAKPDVLCFPIIDWGFRFQRPQQILSRLAREGHRVFYLSQKFLRDGEEPVCFRSVAENVWEVRLRARSPLNIYRDSLSGPVEEGLYQSFLHMKDAARLNEAVCFVHLPFWTPIALRLKKELGFKVIFDCMDDFSGFDDTSPAMLAWEPMLAKAADLVSVTSKALAKKHEARRPLFLPNAADFERFSIPAKPREGLRGKGPVLGYYGAVARWFDAELVTEAARRRPGWRFVIAGHADPAVKARLGRRPNVVLLGELPYQDLPSLVAAFDVCLIPFVVDDLIKATSPVKFFEYLAAGKPVVAARMPELEPFAGHCRLYEGLDEFLARVEESLAEGEDAGKIEARRAVAGANTWEKRAADLWIAAARLYGKASVIVVTHNGLELTKQCVQSLLAKTAWPAWELVVVDNASSDGTPAYLQELAAAYPGLVRVILNAENKGFAPATNQGIRASTSEFVVLLNNDTVVTPGWLGGLLKHLEDERIGVAGPVTNNIGNEAKIAVSYRDLSGLDAFAASYTGGRPRRIFDIPVPAMFCAAFRRALLEEVGLLDERYEVGMFEDDDFAKSVRKAGYRLVCAEDVFIHHVGGAAFKNLDPEKYRRIFEANRARFEEKWGEPWVPHQYRGAKASNEKIPSGVGA